MTLIERLKLLTGHEIIINAPEDLIPDENCNETDDAFVPMFMKFEGMLAEVGEDYILVRGIDTVSRGHVSMGSERFASLKSLDTVTHVSDCIKCTVDSVLETKQSKN